MAGWVDKHIRISWRQCDARRPLSQTDRVHTAPLFSSPSLLEQNSLPWPECCLIWLPPASPASSGTIPSLAHKVPASLAFFLVLKSHAPICLHSSSYGTCQGGSVSSLPSQLTCHQLRETPPNSPIYLTWSPSLHPPPSQALARNSSWQNFAQPVFTLFPDTILIIMFIIWI